MKRTALAALAVVALLGACGHGGNAVRSLGSANAAATDPAAQPHNKPGAATGPSSATPHVAAGAPTRAGSSGTTAVVASRANGAPPPQLPAGPPPTTIPGPPVTATLDNPCVIPGGQQTLTVHTAPHDHLYFSTEYADHTNENTPRGYQEGFGPGTSDATGVFHVTWRVPPNAPIGQAVVHYIAEYQGFTINFTIAAVCS